MIVTFVIDSDRKHFHAIKTINGLPTDGSMKVEIKPNKPNRSLAQNRLLHKWCQCISDAAFEATGKAFGAKLWKKQMKEQFLGYEVSILPDGKVVKELISTKDLLVAPFAEFLTKIDSWAKDNLEVHLPTSDDYYFEAMGIHR